MRVRVYLTTSGLENVANGDSLSAYNFSFYIESDYAFEHPPEGRWFAGEFELKLPSRDTAVMWTEKALRAEAAVVAKGYEERLAKLLALTWEQP